MRWLLLVLFLFSLTGVSFGKVNKDDKLFERGLYQFKIGSYSTALDYFLKLLKPGSKYYKDSLLMLSKTYYAIGRKTGVKKYLWQALNYIQLYFIAMGKGELPWDYYYTKARIYEALSFYEQALAVYRVAFLKAQNQKERVRTTVGIIRTAVWIRRSDIVDEYFILISTEGHSKEEEREITFVKGLTLFSKGEYRKALPFFFKLYKEFEEYLIDNPSYYLLVAENIYRIGNLTLSEQLFRRIVSLTRDREVVRKAILRLGDIELRRRNYRLAFVYYYSVIRDYPNSLEAIVARLKVIPMMERPQVKYRALLSGDKAFKDPIKYIASVLVNYRTTYVGIYALADLGYLIFRLGAPDDPFRRLTWEVSLIFPEEVKYEQREFLRYLWEPYLLKLSPDKGCQLYRSNPRFFHELFGRKVLLKFAGDLKSCNMRKLRIELLSYMLKRWNDDNSKLLMAEALFETKDFRDSLKVLEKVKNKNTCKYLVLKSKLSFFLSVKEPSINRLMEICKKKKSLDIIALTIYFYSKGGKIDLAFKLFNSNFEPLIKEYGKSLVVKGAVDRLIEEATLKERYDIVYEVAGKLYRKGYKNCLIGGYFLLSATRLGKLNEANKVYRELKGCIDPISSLAVTVFENSILEEELRNGAVFRAKAD